MNRRSLLRWFGLAPLAAVVPAGAAPQVEELVFWHKSGAAVFFEKDGSVRLQDTAGKSRILWSHQPRPVTLRFNVDGRKLAEVVNGYQRWGPLP